MCPLQKLHMDFTHPTSLGAHMDEGRAELIGLLGTRIGMIMEDASVVALTLGSMHPGQQDTAIAQLTTAAEQIRALTSALLALRE